MTRLSGIVMDIRRAATPRGRAGLNRFAIEGTRLHERALRAGASVESAVVAESFVSDSSVRARTLLDDLRRSGCNLETVPDSVVTDLTEGRSAGALVGLVRLPEARTLRDVASSLVGNTVFVVAVAVEDPGNFGALARTTLASGAAGLIGVGPGDLYHPKAVRTSMGAVFKLDRLRYSSIEPLIAELDELGMRKLGAVSSRGTPLPRADLAHGPVAIFLGSEAFGLSAETQGAMDGLITVPMAGSVDSLSVNAAAAVILYEACRNQ